MLCMVVKEERVIRSDYDKGGQFYKKIYSSIINDISVMFGVKLSDVEWVMLLKNGTFEVRDDIVTLNVENTVELHSLIDCSLIAQSVTHIKNFFYRLNSKEDLTRFEQYQISVCINSINAISRPRFFLVNAHEIELYERIYEAWGLGDTIDIVNRITEKSVSMFRFLSEYKKGNSREISNIFLAYVSFLLSYEQVLNFVLSFFAQDKVFEENISMIIFILATVIMFAKVFKYLCKTLSEGRVFRHKTR